ncbi:hypothetical protein N9L68_05985 [bacterium]|nr:hypothetical protein [bacterium]
MMGITDTKNIIDAVWQLDIAGRDDLVDAFVALTEKLAPVTTSHGIAPGPLVAVILQVISALSILELRQALRRRSIPQWAAATIRLMIPAWCELLKGDSRYVQDIIRAACSGAGPAGSEWVCALFNRGVLYIGKASAQRAESVLGISERFLEHLRAFKHP